MKAIQEFLDQMDLITRELIFWENNLPVDRSSNQRFRVKSRIEALLRRKECLIDQQLDRMDSFGRVDNETNVL